ncbi:hypothetical protein F4781DRAFT_91319 [Annulohypoxylon bovei var. microspora]|nr:hypothetical protein F4781DRAFT_91319 [Annulohypoxylon bovei var. microspora]
MASSHTLAGQGNGSKPRRTGSIVGKKQYPPPNALPDYVNRALPPRPDSNTSSTYDPLDDGTKRPPIPKPLLPLSRLQHDSLNPSPAGILNEAGLALVHPPPPQLITSAPQQFQPQKKSLEIAAPQPRYPAPIILDTQDHDLIISPVSAPLSGDINAHQSYEVSPLSPSQSQHSFRSGTISSTDLGSGSKRMSSPTAGDEGLALSPGIPGRMNLVYTHTGTHTAHSSGDLAAARLASPHSQVQQIDGRYSDPGSPISGAVIHPPTSFPSDPDLRDSRHVDVRNPLAPTPIPIPLSIFPPIFTRESQIPPRPKSPSPFSQREEDEVTSNASGDLAKTTSGSGTMRVAFAGPGAARTEGFRRARASSKRSAAPPPPLKLSERPTIADAYVKTPFPGAAAPPPPALQRGLSHPTHRTARLASEDKDKEAGLGMIKRLNRVSSLPGFGFARSLRRNSSLGGGEGAPALLKEREKEKEKDKERERGREKEILQQQQQQQQQRRKQSEDARKLEKEGRPSPLPKVRSFLEKARQLSMGHGLGIGMGSEEARKEKRRAEIKRQIRIGEPMT